MTSPVTVVRTFEAEVSAVFAAWISSELLVEPVSQTSMDVAVGGRVHLVSIGCDGPVELDGRFVEVEPDRRLRYTWRWSDSVEESLVDVTFTAAGSATVVEVEHRGFLTEESRRTHLDGWVSYVDGLASLL